jgi:hypothetical protein
MIAASHLFPPAHFKNGTVLRLERAIADHTPLPPLLQATKHGLFSSEEARFVSGQFNQLASVASTQSISAQLVNIGSAGEEAKTIFNPTPDGRAVKNEIVCKLAAFPW